jgi:phosphonate transport system substrate-binding protein
MRPFFAQRRLLCRLAWLLALVSPAWASTQTYSFAVEPRHTPVQMGMRWTPLLDRLETETGERFLLRVQDKATVFEADLSRGVPDFVFLDPYQMVRAAEAHGYMPLVRGGAALRGILVVEANGPVQSLKDLAGARLAFPSPNAFAASLYLRALLAEREGLCYTPVYVGGHGNAYRHVRHRDVAAAGGEAATLAQEPASLRTALRVLYTTPEMAAHAVAAHPRVPSEAREKVRRGLIALNGDAAGRKLLQDAELGGALSADFTRDYLPIARLRIDAYRVEAGGAP